MTCIVAIAHKGTVYMGGDSAGVGGLDLVQRRDKKVFRNGPFIIGFCGSFRAGQVLQYKFAAPTRAPDQDVFDYMVCQFIDSARNALKDAGVAKIENNVEEGELFLVGYQGRLFRVDEDFHVGESVHDFDAIGCGERYALGSLHSTIKTDPTKRLSLALEAAETFCAGVRGPFYFGKQS